MPERRAFDLDTALKDAWLRKAAFGRGFETVELTFHLLRRALGARESERDRMVGFRFREVRSLATEAVRWDRDAAKWVHAWADWLQELGRERMERPIVGTALLGGEVTLERWRRAAEKALWLRGQPANLDVEEEGIATTAPVLFELGTEVILPSGVNANARLFVAAGELDVVGSRGPISVEDLVQAGEEWQQRWLQYWASKKVRPDRPEDPQFEWIQPPEEVES